MFVPVLLVFGLVFVLFVVFLVFLGTSKVIPSCLKDCAVASGKDKIGIVKNKPIKNS